MEVNKKYELTDEKKILEDGMEVFRIRALKDIEPYVLGEDYGIPEGTLGGYVQSEKNLSQDGTCWIFKGGIVTEDARVEENAIVMGYASINGNAIVKDEALVMDGVIMGDQAIVKDRAVVFDTKIKDNAQIEGRATVSFAVVEKNALIKEDVFIEGNAEQDKQVVISDDAMVCGNAHISDHVEISGEAFVGDNAEISGDSIITDNVEIYDAKVKDSYLTGSIVLEDGEIMEGNNISDRIAKPVEVEKASDRLCKSYAATRSISKDKGKGMEL